MGPSNNDIVKIQVLNQELWTVSPGQGLLGIPSIRHRIQGEEFLLPYKGSTSSKYFKITYLHTYVLTFDKDIIIAILRTTYSSKTFFKIESKIFIST